MNAVPSPVLDSLLFVGTHGHVTALDRFTGEERWRTSLPSTGWSIVTLLFQDGVLHAASKGHVFAINPANGEVFWRSDLPKLGSDHVCLATTRTSANAGADPLPQVATAAGEAARAAAVAGHPA